MITFESMFHVYIDSSEICLWTIFKESGLCLNHIVNLSKYFQVVMKNDITNGV